MKLVCFDTETTGLDVQKEHIIQLSLVKFDTETWQVLDQRDWYILPECDFTIPAEAEAVHHISKSFLQEHGVSLRSVYEDLMAFTNGCDMLSYNGNGYDAPILYYNLKRLGLTFDFNRTWYDALLLERIHTTGMTDPATGEKVHNNLTAAYTRYYGHPFEGAHNSLDDVMATIEVFKAQVAAHGWEWAQREEFGFISYDRWLVHKGNYYYLNQGAHKGESIESMMRIDRSYLEWLVDKCQWTDPQTRDIIGPYIGRYTSPFTPSPITHNPSPVTGNPSRGKKRPKGTISDADLSLF
ncbi:MAG: 3'-5' exonuclease [Paludibacteraceae bacterium]|nr:3'-5' exonuclease [Paludibacteraceae bacterium]